MIRTRIAIGSLLILGACSTSSAESTTSQPEAVTTVASESVPTTIPPVSTAAFLIPVGESGVTYDVDGDPPSGPTSFAVLDDGSVVVADTLAAGRGEPRLLLYDNEGNLIAVLDLSSLGVASIVDVATDGSTLSVLDVNVAADVYRLLTLGIDGGLESELHIPTGYRFEDGLTGLLWDDTGVLLEFEGGAWYARVLESGEIADGDAPVYDGYRLEMTRIQDTLTEVNFGPITFHVPQPTALGGVSLVGVGPDRSVVLTVEAVGMADGAIKVDREVRRYTYGVQVASANLDPADQYVDIARPLELAPNGEVLYLAAGPESLRVVPESVFRASQLRNPLLRARIGTSSALSKAGRAKS